MTSRPERKSPRPDAGLGFEGRILRLVKGGPELRAIESGQVDAVIDPATGKAFLLPDAQQALREEQARSRGLLALSADWSWELDENYRFRSHASTAGVAAPYGEVIGKRLWELPFEMEEADWKVHRRLLEWRTTFRDLELRCTDRAGEAHYLSFSGEPIFDRGDRFTGYRGITRDVTERKRLAPIPGSGISPAIVSREAARRAHDEDRAPAIAQKAEAQDRIANHLLAALPRRDYLDLLAGLEPVTLTYGMVLYEPDDAIGHVYFPVD